MITECYSVKELTELRNIILEWVDMKFNHFTLFKLNRFQRLEDVHLDLSRFQKFPFWRQFWQTV